MFFVFTRASQNSNGTIFSSLNVHYEKFVVQDHHLLYGKLRNFLSLALHFPCIWHSLHSATTPENPMVLFRLLATQGRVVRPCLRSIQMLLLAQVWRCVLEK